MVGFLGCAPALPSAVPSLSLAGTDGAVHAFHGPRATVLVFFSEHCPCMHAHDERLIGLASEYANRGVSFFAVDSEVDASLEADRARARSRGYPFPILFDEQARAARAVGAEYATYTVILDAAGSVLYRGGFDSDHTHLSSTATAYVRDALDDIVAGRPVRRPRTEALGCALRTW
jgi:hypothetical protein